MRWMTMALTLWTVGCQRVTPEVEYREAVQLRASLEPYRVGYEESLQAANRLKAETLAWLDGPAAAHSRGIALSEARRLEQRWAVVYFVPRTMHEQLRFDEYRSPAVKAVQKRILDQMRRDYFELHDYERYAKYAAEGGLHRAAAGTLPAELVEYRDRLAARRAFQDDVYPLLATLPRGLSPSGESGRTPASASGRAR